MRPLPPPRPRPPRRNRARRLRRAALPLPRQHPIRPRQARHSRGLTELALARPSCGTAKRVVATTARKRRKRKHKPTSLWGNGKGSFRTRGHYGAATVTGTYWYTEDRCDGTLVRVTRGTVKVSDFVRKRTVAVHAGHSYLARAKRR